MDTAGSDSPRVGTVPTPLSSRAVPQVALTLGPGGDLQLCDASIDLVIAKGTSSLEGKGPSNELDMGHQQIWFQHALLAISKPHPNVLF